MKDSDEMLALEAFSNWFSRMLLKIFHPAKEESGKEKGMQKASSHNRRGRGRKRRPRRKPSLTNFVMVSDRPEDQRGFLLRLFLGNDPVPREVIHLIPWGPVFDSFARECRFLFPSPPFPIFPLPAKGPRIYITH